MSRLVKRITELYELDDDESEIAVDEALAAADEAETEGEEPDEPDADEADEPKRRRSPVHRR